MLLLALVFLFETWIWDSLVAAVRWVLDQIPWAEFRRRARAQFNRWPAIVSVLAFGGPFLVVEGGSTYSVVLMALGHVLMGVAIYMFLKLALLTLVALIFDLTKEKLMSLRWFAFLYEKIQALHHYASQIVAPYREGARRVLRKFRRRSRAFWRRLCVQWGAYQNPAVNHLELD